MAAAIKDALASALDRIRDGDERFIVSVGATLAAVAGASAFLRWRRKRARAARLAGRVKLALLPSETSPIIMMSPATSTVTFFRGSVAAAAEHLEARVTAIVAANPWLTSILDEDPQTGKVEAFYEPGKPSRAFFEVVEGVPLRRGGGGKEGGGATATAYTAMVAALAPVLCTPSGEAVGTGAPLFRVALLPDADAPTERYALVVSANHSLLDGHGFYAVHNMLSEGTAVRALTPERKTGMPARQLEALGGEQSLMAACPPGFLARFVFGQLRNALFPQTVAYGFDVSPTWLARQKAAARAGGEVPWVSTNDCVVSAFLRCLDPDVAMMAINFRGKLEGCDAAGDGDAGNYEDLLTYMRGDYESPALLRRSVGAGAPYRRAGAPPTAMLSDWEHVRGATYGAVTNWSTFAKPLSFGAGEAQELHLPLFEWNKACPACVCGSLVLFRPAAGRVAAMVAGTQALVDAVKASGMAGAALDIAM